MNRLKFWRQFLLAFMAIILAGIGILFFQHYFSSFQKISSFSQKPQANIPAPLKRQANQEEQHGQISLSPNSAPVLVGKKLSLSIKLQTNNTAFSAIAVRLNYKFDRKLPLKPQSLKMKINPLLEKKGLVYLINKVRINWKQHLVTADLAIVNPTTKGLTLNNNETLANLDLIAQVVVPKIDINFDPNQTKLMTKAGREVKLDLKGGVYSVY
jgi:hypothetical protein